MNVSKHGPSRRELERRVAAGVAAQERIYAANLVVIADVRQILKVFDLACSLLPSLPPTIAEARSAIAPLREELDELETVIRTVMTRA